MDLMATANFTSLATVAVAVYASDASRVRSILKTTAIGEVAERFVIGGGVPSQQAATGASAHWVKTTTELIEQLTPDITHVWLIHDDAVPRPDALRALVQAAEQIDASLVGSKVLTAANSAILESVGGSTDVFLVADTGLAAGELDQEQYDVVRDVAFVPGESVLIRRDLLKGLGGPDRLLPPLTQAIDFAGRARSAGGRVAVVPSSEVVHAGTCHAQLPAWREPAARWRASAKMYSGWTTAWVLPVAVLVGLVDAAGRLLMFEVRPILDLLMGVGWSLKHLPNTWVVRRQARKIAQVDDGELFRYQRSGSLSLAQLGSDLTVWARARSNRLGLASRLDEERMFWQRPGFGYLIAALFAVVIGTRSLLLSGMPVAGYVLALPQGPGSAIASYAGAWNPIGFGTAGPGHPAVAALAMVQLVFADSALLVIVTGSVLVGLFGMRRLLRTFGIDGVPAVLGGLAAMGTLAAVVYGDAGYWPAFPAIAATPWMITSVVVAWPKERRQRIGRLGGLLLASFVVAAFAPLALIGALLVALLWAVFGTGSKFSVLIRALGGGIGGLAMLGPWLWFLDLEDVISGGSALPFSPPLWWVVGLGAGVFLAVLAGSEPYLNIAGVGALVLIAGSVLLLISDGLEPSAAGMVLVALGTALVVGGVAGGLPGHAGIARAVLILSQVAVVAALVMVGLTIGTGRWGLPADRYSEVVELVAARSSDAPLGRILFVGPGLPGQTRQLNGVPYKVMNGDLSLGEAWLPVYREADRELETVLSRAVDQDVLRPGQDLGELGIRWVVATAPTVLNPAFENKLDLKQLAVGDGAFTVYENVYPAFVARTESGMPWRADGTTFVGEPAPQVLIAVNPTPFGQSDLPVVMDGSTGVIEASTDQLVRVFAWAAAGALLLAGLAAVFGVRNRA